MKHSFLGIDVPRHLETIRQACPASWQVALCAENEIVEATDSVEAEGILATLLQDKVALDGADTQEAVCGDKWTHLIPVVDHLRTCLGTLLIFGSNGAAMEKVFPRVRLLVEGLQAEVTLSLELADMADELNRRHEELNLIYNTNEQPKDEDDDEQILQTIVENVVDYLEADLVLLSVPSRNVWMVHAAPGVDESSYSRVIDEAEPVAHNWLRRFREPLVVNSQDDLAAHSVDMDIPFKTLIVPITDDREEVIGGLALCRASDGPRILNSDKNLLLALSRRIGKVIQVSFDPMTGLPRRNKFERMLERAISGLVASREQHCLLHVNIDGLSAINEQHGMRTGDAAIELVSKLLMQSGRTADVCGRIGGDELTLLLLNCKEGVAVQKAQEFHETLAKQPFLVGQSRQSLRVSVGVVAINRGVTATEVMTKASVACGIAKERGGSITQVYDAGSLEVTQKREEVRLLTIIHRALEENLFELYAQPIVDLLDADADPHFEVLLRLRDEEGEIVSPVDFIPVAEKHSLMPAIDRWVTRNTLSELNRTKILDTHPKTVCSVNLSGQSFGTESVLDDLQTMLTHYRVPAHNLCFEVTETAAIGDLGGAQYHINNTRKLGCQFALDDFGAGLSSFTYLRMLALDYVKIDGSFVKDMLTDPIARVMVQSIHNVGTAMGLKTVAEYVEDEEIRDVLARMGVHYGQGFGLGKPMPIGAYLDRFATAETRKHG